jgi:bifunctional non-homologous end joining protein LigD
MAPVPVDPIAELWRSAAPMLASGPPEPLRPPEGPQWAFEVKWDGIRALARVPGDGSVALRSRGGRDLVPRLPELAGAGLGAALSPVVAEAILDGECVVLDAAGRPSFPSALRRDGHGRGGGTAHLVVFDVLAWRGDDVRDEPLSQRRALLDDVDLEAATGGRWLVSQQFPDGAALLEATRAQGLEGVMAKRLDSRYACGTRSSAWVKLPHRDLTTVTVVGWVRARSGGGASSLVVADPAGVVLGTVGSGISAALGRTLAEVLSAVERDGPDQSLRVDEAVGSALRRFGDRLRWTDPVLGAEVRHLGRTEGGGLRQPVLHRMRPDLSPGALAGGPV